MKPVDQAAFQMAEYARDAWDVVVPPDTIAADVLKSAFWSHVLTRLRPGALLDVRTTDGLLDMQVRVHAVVNGIAFIHPRFIFEDKERRAPILAAAQERRAEAEAEGYKGVGEIPGDKLAREIAAQVPEGYKVGWNPGKRMFYVQLKALGANGSKLREDFQTRDSALQWAVAHAVASGAIEQSTEPETAA